MPNIVLSPYSEVQDIYIRAGNLKQGDRIIPWDLIINPSGKEIFVIHHIFVRGENLDMRIRKENSIYLWRYRAKSEDKEVLVVLD